MAKVNLDKMNLKELKILQKNVTKAIDQYEHKQRSVALAAAETAAKKMGFSLAELTGVATKKTRAKAKAKKPAPAKYVHPEDSAKTWTGRGRQPAWIKEGLESGKSLDDFLIK